MIKSKSGSRELLKNIGATLARQLFVAFVTLLITVVIARLYGPEGNGILAVALIIPTMLSTFLNLGVSSANVYHLGSKQVSVRQLFIVNIKIYSLLVVLGLAIGIGALTFWGAVIFPGVQLTILWSALIIFPISLLNGYILSVFQGLQLFRPFNKLVVLQSATLFLLVFGILVFGARQLMFLVGAHALSQLIVLIIAMRTLKPLLGKNNNVQGEVKGFTSKTIKYGIKAHVSNILAFINYKADVFLCNFFLGPIEVGVYVIAVALVEKLWMLSQAVCTVILPRLAQLSEDNESRSMITPFAARSVLLLTLIGAFIVAAISKSLISFLFGASYNSALLPLLILLPGIVATSGARVLANDMAARGRPELNMYTTLFVVIVNVLGNIFLIPIFGLAGAAAATTIAYVLNLILRLCMYTRISSNSCKEVLIAKPSDFLVVKNIFTSKFK